MPQIGPLELLTLAAVALIVFGPHRLPEIARTIGKTMSELRRQASEIRDEFATSLEEPPVSDEEPEPREVPSAHGMETETPVSDEEPEPREASSAHGMETEPDGHGMKAD